MIISLKPFITPFNKVFLTPFGQQNVSGAVGDLIIENFSEATDPPSGWSATGNSHVVSEELVSITASAADAFMNPPAILSYDILWIGVDIKLDTGFSLPVGEQLTIIDMTLAGVTKFGLFLINDGGTLKWRTGIRDDAGGLNSITHLGPVFVLNTTYTATINYRRASTNSSSDGGARFWIDSDLMRDSLSIDNFDTGNPTLMSLGVKDAGALTAGTLRNDNLLIGRQGSPPA